MDSAGYPLSWIAHSHKAVLSLPDESPMRLIFTAWERSRDARLAGEHERALCASSFQTPRKECAGRLSVLLRLWLYASLFYRSTPRGDQPPEPAQKIARPHGSLEEAMWPGRRQGCDDAKPFPARKSDYQRSCSQVFNAYYEGCRSSLHSMPWVPHDIAVVTSRLPRYSRAKPRLSCQPYGGRLRASHAVGKAPPSQRFEPFRGFPRQIKDCLLAQ